MSNLKKRTYVIIDGGYLTYIMMEAGFFISADNIERAALACLGEGEELWRILFYHCREYEGETVLPVSGERRQWRPKTHQVIDDLSRRDFFAVRLGTLAFRGWRKKNRNYGNDNDELSDSDFSPVFEQKGVDMRIGLDMASIAERQTADRLILVSADTDLIPALKLCRQRGIQVMAMEFPDKYISSRLQEHIDICRQVEWPEDMVLFESRNNNYESDSE
ncbi:MAG: NYN domain-containing protein [Gammaproteobacteria bacterium WSBS_2016_MAG_OTU1]